MPFFSAQPMTYVVRLIVILSILPVHEFAHAWMSNKLGDPTARQLGRMTINPLVHLDLIGSICLMLAGFGWAKPVPVNPNYFRNRKTGMALTALAGPMSNLIMGFAVLVLANLVYLLAALAPGLPQQPLYVLYSVFSLMSQISVSLAVFNLLPVPPLDGSRILNLVLPERIYFKVMQYERYIALALMALLYIGVLSVPLNYLTNWVFQGISWAADLVLLPFGLA